LAVLQLNFTKLIIVVSEGSGIAEVGSVAAGQFSELSSTSLGELQYGKTAEREKNADSPLKFKPGFTKPQN
jgi:hypothetical protein